MAVDPDATRSRRALLTAAAGTAAALAASAAMPLGVAAHDTDDVQKGTDNPTTATTSISNTNGNTSYGFQATSTGGAGVVAWSVTAPDATEFDPTTDSAYTGVFGYAPAGPDADHVGVGVWGESPDYGLIGTGAIGVSGYGLYGVIGASDDPSGAGVQAYGATDAALALDVHGKVRFNRSGRATVKKNASSVKVSLAGVTTSSRVFAVCFSNRSGRWVRAAVPTTGSFTIYMNAKVSASTYVSWMVLN